MIDPSKIVMDAPTSSEATPDVAVPAVIDTTSNPKIVMDAPTPVAATPAQAPAVPATPVAQPAPAADLKKEKEDEPEED